MSEKKTTPYADFGKRLTKLREEKEMTKQELAGLCGIAPSTEANYESGLRIPQADTAVLMAQVFEISVEELLGVDDPEVEFEKARAIDDMGRLFGKRSADSAQAYIDGTSALLAGGTLSIDDQLDFISVMRKVLIDAELRAKRKYTNVRFRTPEWEKRTEQTQAEVDNVIYSVDAEMYGRKRKKKKSPEEE